MEVTPDTLLRLVVSFSPRIKQHLQHLSKLKHKVTIFKDLRTHQEKNNYF